MPDIIILTEIWIKNGEINLYTIDGFDIIHNSNEGYRAVGVIVYAAEK